MGFPSEVPSQAPQSYGGQPGPPSQANPSQAAPTKESPWAIPDFLFRLLYFTIVPALLVLFSRMFPLTGAMINVGLTLAYFLLSPYLAKHLATRPRVAKLFAKFKRFEDHYRANPPRIFVYYVFYPFLFPYWLVVKKARSEFLLYRSMGVVALLVIVGLALLQYFRQWRPIPLNYFIGAFVAVFLIQVFCILLFMVPLATTTIGYQMAGRKKRLTALFVMFGLSFGLVTTYEELRRHDVVPAMVVARIKTRNKLFPAEESRVFVAALRVLSRAILEAAHEKSAGVFEKDVKGGTEILGDPLLMARGALSAFYKEDETKAFNVVALPDKNGMPVVALFAVDSGGTPILFGGFDNKGQLVLDINQLGPDGIKTLVKFSRR